MSLNWVIETHDSVESTQDIAFGLASMGVPEGQVVQAAVQTKGRGRHHRIWESEPGNLFLSILFKPAVQAQDIGQLSLIAGLALIETCSEFVNQEADLKLKWPNDVLLNDEKCAGLLLETELTQSGAVNCAVVGLGVNVVHAPDGLGVSLQDYADKPIYLEDVRDRFLNKMAQYYVHWLQNGFDDLREKWLSHAHQKGTSLTVKIGPQLEKGSFHDIDAHGNLRLQDDQRRLKLITAGEVYLY